MHDGPDIQQLFPPCVICECFPIQDELHPLYPEEEAIVRQAVKKRKREFSTGRACARRALTRLGFKDCVLARNEDGTAAWPGTVVGTISHSDVWCGSAVARQSDIEGIGLDIEKIERISPQIIRRILTQSELAWLTGYPDYERQQWSALLFSAKESVYKCLFSYLNSGITYYDACIMPVGDGLTFTVTYAKTIAERMSAQLPLAGRYFFHEGAVFTGVALLSRNAGLNG